MGSGAVASIAVFTCVEALRNRLTWLAGLVLVAGFVLTEFLGAVAITETREIQSAVLGALLRFSAVFVVSLFVITSVVREFNDKGLELVLSLPVPRASYYLGKLAGFSVIGLGIAVMFGALLLVYVPVDQVLIWTISLFLEMLIVIALSLLALFTFSQVTPALTVVAAFYLLSRSIAAMQLMAGGPLAAPDSVAQRFMDWLADAIAFLLPELHRFTQTDWLVYHGADWSDLLPVAGQSLIYLALLSGAALFDLYRREL